MEYKAFPTVAGAIEGRVVTGYAAVMGNVDTGNDRVINGAFKKTIKEQKGRIKHLWVHNLAEPPTATILELAEVKREELPAEIRIDPTVTGGLKVVREYLNTIRGNEILAAIEAKAITEMSFGYDPIRFDFEEDKENGRLIRNLKELRLYDTSDVVFGMNSLTIAAAKKAVPYKDTGNADEGSSWSAPSLSDFGISSFDDLSDSEKDRIGAHFAFSSNWPPESYGDLKLPHHQAGSSGVGKAVWRGVAAAMGALLGARGGVELPSADRRSVYNHLVKHYEDFDKEPPDYKLIELSGMVTPLLVPGAVKEGRVLSKRNLEKLLGALDVLNEILLAAVPSDEEKTHTEIVSILERINKLEYDISMFNFRNL